MLFFLLTQHAHRTKWKVIKCKIKWRNTIKKASLHYCVTLQQTASLYIIIITYLSWSWATCWPVPVSRIQKSFQRSTMIPSASWGVVFLYPGYIYIYIYIYIDVASYYIIIVKYQEIFIKYYDYLYFCFNYLAFTSRPCGAILHSESQIYFLDLSHKQWDININVRRSLRKVSFSFVRF